MRNGALSTTPSTSDENFWSLRAPRAHDLAHRRHVGGVQRPAERVDQQLSRWRPS
jgi:hypothetical protein